MAILLFLLVGVIYLTFGDNLTSQFANFTLPERLLIASASLALPSLLLGMVFPIGLKLISRQSSSLIPWILAIDGTASVVGGVLSKIVFIVLGFQAEFLIVLVTYLLALLILVKLDLGTSYEN